MLATTGFSHRRRAEQNCRRRCQHGGGGAGTVNPRQTADAQSMAVAGRTISEILVADLDQLEAEIIEWVDI